MRFYIASTLENAEMVRWFAGQLKSWGWQQTYDWTVHGPVQGPLLAETAEKELSGVKEADIVFVLFPAKRGTHVELGAAIALKKKIILWAQSEEELFLDGRTCAFYHSKGVARIIGDRNVLLLAAINASPDNSRIHCVV